MERQDWIRLSLGGARADRPAPRSCGAAGLWPEDGSTIRADPAPGDGIGGIPRRAGGRSSQTGPGPIIVESGAFRPI